MAPVKTRSSIKNKDHLKVQGLISSSIRKVQGSMKESLDSCKSHLTTAIKQPVSSY